jgi:hypothetical protein
MNKKQKKLREELEDRIDLEDARKALADAKRNGTIPWEQIRAELGLDKKHASSRSKKVR